MLRTPNIGSFNLCRDRRALTRRACTRCVLASKKFPPSKSYKLLRFCGNVLAVDLIRGYGYLKTKNVPIVCYLTRSRRSNRILFFARDAFEEEGGGFMKKKRGDAKNESVEERKQNSRKNARKIFVFAKRNCFFSHQKLIRNRARRAPKWTKRNVNLNRNDTSGDSCSCLVFCKPSKLQKPLRPHRLSKLVFYHRQEKGDENIAFKRASVREV